MNYMSSGYMSPLIVMNGVTHDASVEGFTSAWGDISKEAIALTTGLFLYL